MQEFFRIRRLPPYVFEQVNRAKAAARNAGADIIDLGMGNPDLPAPLHVVDKLKETVGKPRTDRYSASRGIPGLRRAQAAYYRRRFGVKLDPEREIVATLGSKEGFANVAQAIIAPGDVVLVPNPSYPIHAFGFLMAGGVIRSVPSDPTPSFFEALEQYHPDYLNGKKVLTQISSITWSSAEVFARAMQIATRSNDNPGRQDLIKALATFKDETLGGLVPPLTYGDGTSANPQVKCFWYVELVAKPKPHFVSPYGMKTVCQPS